MGSPYTVPYAPREPFRPSNLRDITELILRGGDIAAQRQLQSGEIWGNAISGIGNAVGQGIGQIVQHREQKKEAQQLTERTHAWLSAMKSGDLDDPQKAPEIAVSIWGPEDWSKHLEAYVSGRKLLSGQEKDPAKLIGDVAKVANSIKDLPDSDLAQMWAGVVSPVAKAAGLDAGEVYNPKEHRPFLLRLAKLAQTTPKTREIKVRNTDGSESIQIVEDVPGQTFNSAAETPKDFEWVTRGGSAVQIPKGTAKPGDVPYSKPEKPKETPEPADYVFNPEGVVLSSYGGKERNEVRRQAMERGLPVFETATAQLKGSILNGVAADARELQGLLDDPEVQKSVGFGTGSWTKLKSRVVDLPPKVQRAVQLMTSLSDSELRKRSGAQINEKEMARLLQFTTDISRPLGHNRTAVAGLLKSASRDYHTLSGQLPPGSAPEPIEPLVSHGSYLSTDPDAGERIP